MRTITITAQAAVLLIATASAGLGEMYSGMQGFLDDSSAVFTVWSQPIKQQPKEHISRSFSIDYIICNFDRKNGALVYNWETAGMHSADTVGLPLRLCNGSSLPAGKIGILDGDSIEFTQAKRRFTTKTFVPDETVGQRIENLAKSVFNLFYQEEGQETFKALNIEFSIIPDEVTTQYIIDWDSNDVTIAIPQRIFDKIGGEEVQRVAREAKIDMRVLAVGELQFNQSGISELEVDGNIFAFTRTSESLLPLSFNVPLSRLRYSRERMYVINSSTNTLIYSLTYMGAAYE